MKLQQGLSKRIYTACCAVMGKRITEFIFKYWSEILLGILVFSYIAYFSWFTILRYRTLYASYFDLGIMHQTVYNTFISLKTWDFSRFLEMTNPHGFDQVKRMAVHNDPLLALIAPLYFIYSGPETLLVLQSVLLGLGAIVIYAIGRHVFNTHPNKKLISLFFAFSYLFYPPLQLTNHFDFHAAVLATPFLLCLFYFFLKRKYRWCFVFISLSLLAKEQVGLTISFFGLYALTQIYFQNKKERKHILLFGLTSFIVGIAWFFVSMKFIIPHFRSGLHFALEYFGDFGDSTTSVFVGLITKPNLVFQYIFRKDTYEYLYTILGPLGFISLLAPIQLLIVTPELAINLLSKSGAMRNIYFHYTAIITPFVYISGIYGFKRLVTFIKNGKKYSWFIVALFIVCTAYFSFTLSPMPYSVRREIHPIFWPAKESTDAFIWQKKLENDSIKVMITGHMAPVFASRRYLYNFSARYDLADYVVLSVDEVYNSSDSTTLKPVYGKLLKDTRFVRVYKNQSFEVYKKI